MNGVEASIDTAHNPYAAPSAALLEAEPGAAVELGGRGARLVAAVIDYVLNQFAVALLTVLIFKATGYDQSALAGLARQPFLMLALIGAVNLIAHVLIHGYLIARRGQTVGKWIMRLRILTMQGEVASFGRIVFMRTGVREFGLMVPLAGALALFVNPFFVFRKDRRCLHDLIAGTQVCVVPRR